MTDSTGSDEPKRQLIAQFLVAEFGVLNERAGRAENSITSKVNFYFVICTAAVGGAFLIADNTQIMPHLAKILLALSILLSVMGVVTFQQTLDLSASATIYYRRAGRIREWFLVVDPIVRPFLPFTATDDLPKLYSEYSRLRGVESALIVVNSAFLAGIMPLAWLVYRATSSATISSLVDYGIALLGVVVFVIAWFVQLGHARRFFQTKAQSEKDKHMVHFPLPLDNGGSAQSPGATGDLTR